MAGNVWEWTSTLYKRYPYNVEDGRESKEESGRRFLRGGSFLVNQDGVRCASRFNLNPDHHLSYVGFRICVSPVS